MNRAERRRIQRAMGRKRADGKKGRRPSTRVPASEPELAPQPFEHLARAGFVVARAELDLPEQVRGR